MFRPQASDQSKKQQETGHPESLPEANHSEKRHEASDRSSSRAQSEGWSLEASPAKTLPQPSQNDVADGAERNIKNALSSNSRNLDAVFSELKNLQSHEGAVQFKQDLRKINADLQKNGLLPGLEIVLDKNDQLAVQNSSVASSSLETSPSRQENFRPGSALQTPAIAHNDSSSQVSSRNDSERQVSSHNDSSRQVSRHYDNSHHSSSHHGSARHAANHHGGYHYSHHSRRGPGASHAFDAYSGVKAPDEATLAASVRTVLNEAKALGLSPEATKAAVASMLVESKGNPLAQGDGNTSFGLFQLHRGGELTEALRLGKLQSEDDAFDPSKNAQVALSYFKKNQDKIADPGRLAATAQRPKYGGEYADKVNSLVNSGTVDNLIAKYESA